MTILYQRPFGHGGFTDPAADRRGDFGVGQIDARGFNGSFRRDHGRIALLRRRNGGIVVLLTNIFGAQQFLITLDRQLIHVCRRLGFCQVAFGAVIAGLIGGWIDLIQRDAGLDIATFHEVTF